MIVFLSFNTQFYRPAHYFHDRTREQWSYSVSRKNGTIAIAIDVYRKPTHTDRHLDYSSHHDKRHKISAARNLIHRSSHLPRSDISPVQTEQARSISSKDLPHVGPRSTERNGTAANMANIHKANLML